MNVSFVCNDTRGGVQPYLALAHGLADLGHAVQIVAPEGFRSDVAATGLRFTGIEGNVQEHMRRPEVLEAMERGLLATHRIMVRLMDETIRTAMRECLRAAIGFGSMSSRDARATADLVLQAAEQARCRVVLLSGWGGMAAAALPEWACMVEGVPHDWLYPRCAAVVHHGGAGTTGASTRAGIPAVIVPFAADQPFWAWLVEHRGIGVCAGPRKRLTSSRLADAIRRVVSDARMRDRAGDMGRRVRAESGVAAGAGIIHRWCSR